jgi:hypothetical protein
MRKLPRDKPEGMSRPPPPPNPPPARRDYLPNFGLLRSIDDASVEAACRAHWPTWDRMRPDHARKWRAKMRAALEAAEAARLVNISSP